MARAVPRISRRRALALGAGGAGALAAGGAAWALRGAGSQPPSAPSASPTASASPRQSPTALPSPTTPARGPVRGGIARLVSRRRFSFDTFDVVRSGEPSIAEVLGRTHQRLIEWTSFIDGTFGPGVATSWQQHSDTSWTFDVDPGAAWRGDQFARPLTADDVVDHLARVLAAASAGNVPLSQRPWRYATIERVEAPDLATVRIDTAGPDPFLLETLASPFASIQSQQAIAAFEDLLHERRPEHLVGSGPFAYRGSGEGGSLIFERHADGAANLDGLVVFPGGGDSASFLEWRTDEFIARDRRDTAEVRASADDSLSESPLFEDSPVVSTLAVGAPPWHNPQLRLALSAALNRGWLAGALFGARAAPSGVVPPSSATPFQIAESELQLVPGYGPDPEVDAGDARARWLAAGGDALGQIQLDIPAVFDPLYNASATVSARLREVLGVDVRVEPDSYTGIAGKVARGFYGNGNAALWFGWGPATASPDPSLNLLETFHSASATAQVAGYHDSAVDDLLASVRVEFDPAQRARLVLEVQSEILKSAGGGVLPWLLQRSEHFSRRYLVGPARSPFEDAHLDALRWLDPEGPRLDFRAP